MSPSPPAGVRSFGRWLVVVALLLLAAAIGYWWLVSHTDDATDAATVTLPATSHDRATRSYMHGPGRVLLRLLHETDSLDARSTKIRCRTLVRDRLGALGSPAHLQTVASRIPDPTLRDAYLSHIANVVDYVAACGAGSGLASAAHDVEYVATVIHRRLEQEGVS